MQKDKEQSKWCIVAFILHYRNAQSCPSVIYTASTLLKMGYIRGPSVLSPELSWRWGMVDKGKLASVDEIFTRKGVS